MLNSRRNKQIKMSFDTNVLKIAHAAEQKFSIKSDIDTE